MKNSAPTRPGERPDSAIQAARARAGERGEPPPVGGVRSERGACDSAGQHDAGQRAECRDETVGGDSPLGGCGEQEREGHDSDERRQHAPCDADENRGMDAARERRGPDVPIADVAPQHPASGRHDDDDRQHEGEGEGRQRLPVGPARGPASWKPLVERRIRQPSDDAERVRPGIAEDRPRQRRRSAFEKPPGGAFAPCLGDAFHHLPGAGQNQLRLLEVAFALDAAFLEDRPFRRDRRRLGRLAFRRRRPQSVEKLLDGRGVGRRRGGRDRRLALKRLDLGAQCFDDGGTGLRPVELGGDEVEQQAPVGGLLLDGKDGARRLGERARRAHETEHQQRNRVDDATMHGGADSPGGQCNRS